jgi:hypothetical protein
MECGMKTPEELAEEYATLWYMGSNNERKNGGLNPYKYDAFLAGYEAARGEYEAKIKELEIELDNWKHTAIHGDEGL